MSEAAASGRTVREEAALRSRLAALLRRDERITLAAAALLGLVVAAIVWRLIAGGGEAAREAVSRPASLPAPAAVALRDRRLGIALRRPATWRTSRRGGVVRLVSADRTMEIAIASPTSGALPRRVQRDAERALRSAYRPARIVRRLPGRLGRTPARTTELVATQGGRKIRILSVTAASRWRTYQVALFSALPPAAGRLVEAREIVRSFAFQRPRAR